MTQSPLFPIEVIDPVEVVSEAHRIARQTAYDVWQAAFLRRDYARREAAKQASGDRVRIGLLAAYEQRQRERAA